MPGFPQMPPMWPPQQFQQQPQAQPQQAQGNYIYKFNNLDPFTLREAHLVQAVTCLTAYLGVRSLILAQSHTFVEIDQEIISMPILLPSAD